MNATKIGEEDHSLFETSQELYDAAPCGYLSTTPDGRIVRVNRTFADWIGAAPEELTGGARFVDLLTIGGKIFYETHFALLIQMQGFVNEVALDFVCKQGGTIPALVTAVQKRTGDGKPLVNRITVFNASERRRYERELLLAKKRAEDIAAQLSQANAELARSNHALLKANEDLSHFIYAANHDMQEPLRNATMYAQLLAKRYAGALDEDALTFIQSIVSSTHRMNDLIQDLLEFSRAGGSPLILRSVNLRQPLDIAVENLRLAIEESAATIDCSQLPCLQVDVARMAQVFQNLIGNAVKYRRLDEPLHIRISARKEEAHYVIYVRDNGMGFDPRYAEQIFEIFKRLHNNEIPGTGIGLAICKKIVNMHGGQIWATSTIGAGSCFSFSIPERWPS